MDQPANQPATLTPEDLKNLTEKLSQELDQEIKNQLSHPRPAQPQQSINQTLKEPEPKVSLPNPPEAKPEPEVSVPPPAPSRQPETPSGHTDSEPYVALDPLQASVNAALENLKEGDKVDGWKLSKTYSTSFGRNKSVFYELENDKGAKKTLNTEEIKALLKQTMEPGPPNLSPQEKQEPPKEVEEKPAPIEPKLAPEKVNPITRISTKDKVEEPKEAVEKPNEDKKQVSSPGKLSDEQTKFLKQIHADPKLWQQFVSFKSSDIEKVQTLYQEGKLPALGIEAHPLLDHLKNPDLGQAIVVKKGDSISSILTAAGYQLSFQATDSFILGVHVLGNNKFIQGSLEKIQNSGLSTPNLPSEDAIIRLTSDGNKGNTEDYQKLLTLLTFLPVGSRIQIYKPEEIEALKKYFA